MPSIPIGLVGPSSHTNVAFQTGRTINLYPEMGERGAKAPAVLFSTPGLTAFAVLSDLIPGSTEIRGLYAVNDRLFVVVGSTLLEVRGFGDFHTWGNIPTNRGPVGISSNGDVIVVGDGTGFYLFDLDAGTVAPLLSEGEPIRGWFSGYVDGRTIYLEKDSDRFHYSALDDASTVDGLNYATAEGNPDPAVAMFVINRELVFLGTASTEFWGPTGDSDNPFSRIGGGFQERGCAARWGAKPFADAVIYIGQDKSGHAQVYLQGPAGGAPQPISNHGVERDINIALRDYDPDDVRSFEYTDPGHKFWVLSLPNGVTWAFDLNTRLWHERGELDASTGLWRAIRQEHHAFWQGEHYVGGSRDAVLYKQSRQYHTIAGDPLVRFRETDIVWAQGKTLTIRGLELHMQVATGLDGSGQGTAPLVMLQVSRDGGRTFGNEMHRPVGGLGDYLTRVRFGPCGRGQNFVFRVSGSDPVPYTLIEGFADVEVT